MIVRVRSAVRPWAAAALALGLTVWPLGAALAGAAYVAAAPVRRRYADAGALALVGLFGGLATALSPHPLASVLPWLGWLALGAAFVLLAQRWSRRDAGAATVGFALGLVLTLGQEWRQRAVLGALRPEGFTLHPNLEAALLLGVLGAVAVGSSRLTGRRWARLGAWLALGAGLAALVLTGSRGGLLGLTLGGATGLVLYLARFRWGPLLRRSLAVAGLAVAALAVSLATAGGGHRNQLRNSGFEDGLVPWSLGGGSALVAARASGGPAGGGAVRLVIDKVGGETLLTYEPDLPVHPGEVLTLSLYVHPQGADAPQAFVRVEARGADGAFVAQVGKNGWTTRKVAAVGERLALPTTPADAWRRVSFTLPPVPAGAATLHVVLTGRASAPGAYGLVDALQLQEGNAATAYVPGGQPGLASLLAPEVQRVELAMHDPTVASGRRLQTWWAGVQIAAARPVLGYGPGSEIRVDREYALDYVPRPLEHFHSFYLKMLIEGGSATLAAFLGWVGLVAWRLFRRYRAGSLAAMLGLATLVALLVHSVFDPVLSWPAISGALWLALCSAMYGDEDAPERAAGTAADGGATG